MDILSYENNSLWTREGVKINPGPFESFYLENTVDPD